MFYLYTMAKQDTTFEVEGSILEALPNTMFRVELDNGHVVLCTLSGKLRMNFIKILPGDRVKLQMSVYDMNKGRITYRCKT